VDKLTTDQENKHSVRPKIHYGFYDLVK